MSSQCLDEWFKYFDALRPSAPIIAELQMRLGRIAGLMSQTVCHFCMADLQLMLVHYLKHMSHEIKVR